MNRKIMVTIGISMWVAVLGVLATSAQDKYTAKVPGGLAMSEFKGYEAWQAISISRNERVVAMRQPRARHESRAGRASGLRPGARDLKKSRAG